MSKRIIWTACAGLAPICLYGVLMSFGGQAAAFTLGGMFLATVTYSCPFWEE